MPLPFSQRARPWEVTANALRRLKGDSAAPFDPWELAQHVGLHVVDGTQAAARLDVHERTHILDTARSSWSGGVYPKPLPDGSRICILNPTHGRRRQKITLMEEIAHVYLEHVPSSLVELENGIQVREYRESQEQEAYGVGAAALVPWEMLFPNLNSGLSILELAEMYDVSTELISYRIKITGASRLYRARQNIRA